MNSTSKSKANVAKNAAKPSRKQRKTARAGLRATVGGAPVAVSNDLRQYTRFSSGRSGETLKMTTCCAISEVLRNIASPTKGALWLNGLGVNAVQLSLTSPYGRLGAAGFNTPFTSPVWDLIGSAFTRYRVNKLVFHYEPQSATTNGERLVFAFARDPDHPLLWTATPSSANNLSVSDSVAFMPWRAWSLDVSKEMDNTLYYTYDFNASTTSATDRFSNFGVISCVTSGPTDSNDPCGVLYMETEIEFLEFCPISVTRPSLVTLGEKLSRQQALPAAGKEPTPQRPKEDEQEAMLRKLAETYHILGSR